MSLDLSKFKERLNNETQKQFYNATKFKKEFAPFIQPRDLERGVYKIRLLPADPKKNPIGGVLRTNHWIKWSSDEKRKARRFFCPGFDKCLACTIATYHVQNSDAFNDRPDIKAELTRLIPYDEVLYYVALTAKPINKEVEKNGNRMKVTSYVPGDKWMAAIFTVRNESGINQKLITLSDECPFLNDSLRGRNLILEKSGKYDLRIEPNDSPLPEECIPFLDNYPNLVTMGEKTFGKSPEWIEDTIEKSWWYQPWLEWYEENFGVKEDE